ncbi:FAD-binding oxidoreductase [Oricola sp.]|uniref:FAD-binding oxidoreductase n=1 Tax=Oricola sp. TaxID=1979950 RepID=UPI00351365FC
MTTSSPSSLDAFKAEIDGIRWYDDPRSLELRSRDYYWYSPVLKGQLDDMRADIVVLPTTEEEIKRVAAAAVKCRLPLTLRGGGTGNYGQCIPLKGGVVMDLTRLDRVIAIEDGLVRVQAGARIARLDDAVRETGQELLMYPSTRTIATIGGFVAGGSGGIGSLRHGMLRDAGNMDYVKVVTVEDEPQVIELRGDEVQKVQHAYGTNGIIVEIGLALTKATDWIHTAALFDGYEQALRFCMETQENRLDLYLLTCVERRFSPYYRKFGDRFPADRDAVFAMVAPDDMARFCEKVEERGGSVSFSLRKDEIAGSGLQPAYECGWNHTTLQALKVDKSWTYLQVAYPYPFDPALAMRQMNRYGAEIYWHHEVAMMGGRIQIFALPLVKWHGKDRIDELMAEIERDGCTVFNPHVVTIEEGGMKQIDTAQIEFKRQADPYGLMNPGKTLGWTDAMARS